MQQLRLLHGGDYNPEQWLDRPDILAQDIELMKKAHVNTVTLGVFSWSTLEPQEGVFELDWLADIIHNLYANGIYTILATPSAARPAWMAHKYPEVRRVRADRVRELYNRRQNYCYTSPVYREKVRIIDQKLAQRFGTQEGGALRVTHDLTQEEIAQLVGASRETVNKALADFAHRGWIRLEGKSVLISDSERLARRAR